MPFNTIHWMRFLFDRFYCHSITTEMIDGINKNGRCYYLNPFYSFTQRKYGYSRLIKLLGGILAMQVYYTFLNLFQMNPKRE